MSMLFLLFSCFTTGMCVYCILNRVNKRTVDLAVHAAVHEVRKEFHERNTTMVAQLAAKERELSKARELLKLHAAVPAPATPAARPAPGARAARSAKDEPQPDGLHLFQMSRPFTDTSYDALVAVSDVVKVEPTAM